MFNLVIIAKKIKREITMDIMGDAVSTHVFMVFIFLSIMIFNIINVYRQKSFIKLAKTLRFMTPVYHVSNAMLIYTGMIVAAYSKHVSLTVALMIIAGIFLLVIEIKRFKKMRVIKVGETKLQDEFRVFAKKIYKIEISVLICVYLISKVF